MLLVQQNLLSNNQVYYLKINAQNLFWAFFMPYILIYLFIYKLQRNLISLLLKTKTIESYS
jgi:hypothetical protein